MRFLFFFALLTACDDDAVSSEPVDDGVLDAIFEDAGQMGSAVGPVIQIPIAVPVVGNLIIHVNEMSNAQAAALGAPIQFDEGDDNLPVVTTHQQGAAIANALSVADGLPTCYPMPIQEHPTVPRMCDGWRIPTRDEFEALFFEEGLACEHGTPCVLALDEMNVCYSCTCPDGPANVGGSAPYGYGLRDLLGNAAELVNNPIGLGGTDFQDSGCSIGSDPVNFRGIDPQPNARPLMGGVRLVRLPALP